MQNDNINRQKLKFLNALQNDEMIIRNLPLQTYRLHGDQFNNCREYIPTAFVYFDKGWIPVEIKASKRISPRNEYLDLKRNQVLKMNQIEGAFLFSSEKFFTLITAKSVLDNGEELHSDIFDKPCLRITKEFLKWNNYPMPLRFS